MSADNWTICPKCESKRLSEISKAYGNIPQDAYSKLLKDSEPESTLREYYWIGTRDGVFAVDYSCSCSGCDFSYTYNHTEAIKPPLMASETPRN